MSRRIFYVFGVICAGSLLAKMTVRAANLPASPSPPPAATLSGPSEPPAAANPTPVSDEASWTDLAHRLGDPDPAVRQTAQEKLQKTTWRDLDLLQQFADQTADLEAKARIAGRIQEIKDAMGVDPPPLTLHLKDATLADLGDALTTALGGSPNVTIWPPNNADQGRFTLDAVDVPFWEVFLKLAKQQPLEFQYSGQDLRLVAQGGRSWRNGVVVGPVIIVAQNISRNRSVDFQGPAQPLTEIVTFSYLVGIDPRLNLIQFTPPTFSEIIDDHGHNLVIAVPNAPVRRLNTLNRSVITTSSTTLRIPDKDATKIVSAKGVMAFTAALHEEVVEIDDPASKVNTDFKVGKMNAHLSAFDYKPDQDRLNFTVQVSRGPPANIPGPIVNASGQQPEALTVAVIDATGKTVFSNITQGGLGAGVGGVKAGPLKLRLSAPTKTKDVRLEFELKDLPLP